MQNESSSNILSASVPAPSSIAPVAIDTKDDAYFDSGSDLRGAGGNVNATGRWLADATATFRRVRLARQVPFGHKVIVGAVVALSIAILSVAGVETVRGSTATNAQSTTSSSSSTALDRDRAAHIAIIARIGRDATARGRALQQSSSSTPPSPRAPAAKRPRKR